MSPVSFGDGIEVSGCRLLRSTDVIYVSAAGSMLCQIINSLLLLPVSVARPLLSHLLDLLPPLDRLNRLLPAASPLEDQELQWPLHGERTTLRFVSCLVEEIPTRPLAPDPSLAGTSDFAEPVSGMSFPQPALSWVWLVDLERTVALLVGRCLGGMLQGAPTSLEEQDTAYWLKTPLFSNGLEMDIPQLGTGALLSFLKKNKTYFAINNNNNK